MSFIHTLKQLRDVFIPERRLTPEKARARAGEIYSHLRIPQCHPQTGERIGIVVFQETDETIGTAKTGQVLFHTTGINYSVNYEHRAHAVMDARRYNRAVALGVLADLGDMLKNRGMRILIINNAFDKQIGERTVPTIDLCAGEPGAIFRSRMIRVYAGFRPADIGIAVFVRTEKARGMDDLVPPLLAMGIQEYIPPGA